MGVAEGTGLAQSGALGGLNSSPTTIYEEVIKGRKPGCSQQHTGRGQYIETETRLVPTERKEKLFQDEARPEQPAPELLSWSSSQQELKLESS